MHHLGRMPSHESLRPSTSQYSSSAIRVRHEISMEVICQAVEGGGAAVEGPKKLVIVRPLQLSSVSRLWMCCPLLGMGDGLTPRLSLRVMQCCCFVDSLMLPSYSVDQPDVDTSPSCLCGYSIEEWYAFPSFPCPSSLLPR